jgi:hypothetical protein
VDSRILEREAAGPVEAVEQAEAEQAEAEQAEARERKTRRVPDQVPAMAASVSTLQLRLPLSQRFFGTREPELSEGIRHLVFC